MTDESGMLTKTNGQTGLESRATLDTAIRILRDCNTLMRKKIKPLQNGYSKEYYELLKYIKTIEDLVAAFETCQEAGDMAISLMPSETREKYIKEAPGLFQMFGWQGRVDDEGNIVHNA